MHREPHKRGKDGHDERHFNETLCHQSIDDATDYIDGADHEDLHEELKSARKVAYLSKRL